MATLYFHIPFCKRICTYCDFYKVGAIELIPKVVEAMHGELDSRASYLSDRGITSIYFGGGTPSLIAPEEIEGLISHARRLFDCAEVGEITLEANPDDLTEEYIARLRQTSINRISLGIQSFDDRVLGFMNRRHSADEAEQAVRRLRAVGFDNISIDIIFGVAGFGDDHLAESLRRAIDLNVEHISAYHLTVEPRTRLGVMMRKGEYVPVDEERSEAEYMAVHKRLVEAGYDHYEVSNYARAGRYAEHNSAYWRHVPYVGLGPGAHSCMVSGTASDHEDGVSRQWNDSDLNAYLEAAGKGDFASVRDNEVLTRDQYVMEHIMLALRTSQGVGYDYLERNCDAEALARAFAAGDLVRLSAGNVRIPEDRFFVSDSIIADLV